MTEEAPFEPAFEMMAGKQVDAVITMTTILRKPTSSQGDRRTNCLHLFKRL